MAQSWSRVPEEYNALFYWAWQQSANRKPQTLIVIIFLFAIEHSIASEVFMQNFKWIWPVVSIW